ncbi:GNAT family N-acetyltransferase [Massilia atriviolacea]|uniref:GNAT family N-acetyltransferase n=1 Tax=Massilia atriviolacea TaxID=2495579 RepID=A0A430HLN3_9BURK|nr:GNAT family N-acetyltransferase [Massilia atriviolacea]RSZ58382.1 GNAT family N-acetyltransferase [Massilia atriviolacea]
MQIRRLVPADAPAYQALRLAALRESPAAFSASYEDECGTPLPAIEAHMAPDSGRYRFGAFDGDALVGVVGVGRESGYKLHHKAFVGGMVVAPAWRKQGVGRQLLAHALAFADAMPGLRQVTLTITAGNAPALALYASMGFCVFGQEPRALCVGGQFHDTIYMLREVTTGAAGDRCAPAAPCSP